MVNRPPRLLSIAGSDPSGGAGVQGDLKTFAAFGCYGMAAITALTAQNTHGVRAVFPATPDIVARQIETLLEDAAPAAIKIGMAATPENAAAIARALGGDARNVVIDPVLRPTQGVSLATHGLEQALLAQLVPIGRLITPNLDEAAALTGAPRAHTPDEMADQARRLIALGARAALVTGGDLDGAPVDALAADGEICFFAGRRIATRHTHGTGCALSAAIASRLAYGDSLTDAIAAAKSWLEAALAAADALNVGDGRGPPHHFFELWTEGVRPPARP
jgi:hydroxymethylpyrimidine/phosphomethylpyrimidine kinase